MYNLVVVCIPRYKNILFVDWAVFLSLFGYIIVVAFFFAVFLVTKYPFADYGPKEWLQALSGFLVAFMLTTPIVFWWCSVIRSTFRTGIVMDARVTSFFGVKGPYVGIYYEFSHDSVKYEHTATLLNRKVIRNKLENDTISIVFDPRKRVSFIYEAYCPEDR
jgi:hypothetical protein